jgi:hypothetical protein
MVAAGGRSSSPRTLPTLTKWRPWGCVAPSPNRKVSAGCSHLQCHPGEGEPAHPTYPTARLPSRNVARECHPAPKEVAESQLVRDTWVGILIGRESSSLGRTCKILRTSRKGTGGESGIRTHGRVSPTHAFQACSFNHSDISPSLESTVCEHSISHYRRNCVRPPNVRRSLTAFFSVTRPDIRSHRPCYASACRH